MYAIFNKTQNIFVPFNKCDLESCEAKIQELIKHSDELFYLVSIQFTSTTAFKREKTLEQKLLDIALSFYAGKWNVVINEKAKEAVDFYMQEILPYDDTLNHNEHRSKFTRMLKATIN